MKHVLFASTSGIAQAVAEEFLQRKKPILLCARNPSLLKRQVTDLQVKYDCTIDSIVWDLADESQTHQKHVEALFKKHSIAGLFMCAGVMPPQEVCESNPKATETTFQLNLTAITVLLNMFAEKFIEQGHGYISCVSSVAGDRGRQSNYIYGAAKAGMTAYLQGLRNRLHKQNILVQTVKPGPVRTKMTANIEGRHHLAEPEIVARDIVNGIKQRKDIVYTPRYWRYIMSVIRNIPEPLFKRMSL